MTAAVLSLSSSSTVEYSSLLGTRFFLAIQLKFSFTWLPPITPNYRLIKPLDYCEQFPSLPSPTSTFLQRIPGLSTELYKTMIQLNQYIPQKEDSGFEVLCARVALYFKSSFLPLFKEKNKL